MKVEAECAACLINRAAAEVMEATLNPAFHFRTMVDLLRLLSREFKPTSIPAILGTKRDRLIKRITGNTDPYKRIKRISNEKALKLLPYVRKIIEAGYTQKDRFRRACRCAIVGNIMEFHVLGHNFKFTGLRNFFHKAEKDLVIDDTDRIYNFIKNARTLLYLVDNAGEIVFDTLLVEQLKNMGIEVVVGVKGGPVANDATLEDAEVSGMSGVADKIITTGTDSIGLILSEVSQDFLDVYNSVDIIFAKGMGHAETLTEYKLGKPHVLFLRTKCNPVANFFGVRRGKNVAKWIS